MREIPLRLWLLAMFSGLLQVLPFPMAGPTPLWRTALCWIALVPLLVAFLGKSKAGKALSILQTTLLGYACGVVWYAGNCYWIYQTMYLYGGLSKPVSAVILLLFCLYLGLYHAAFGLLFAFALRSRFGAGAALAASPFLWVVVELGRARITSFPWDLLGYSQIDNQLLTRLAPWTGVYGISFLIVAANAIFTAGFSLRQQARPGPQSAPLLRSPALLWAGAGILLTGTLQAGTYMRRPRPPATHTAVLLQANLEVGAERADDQLSLGELLSRFGQLSEIPSGPEYAGLPVPGKLLAQAGSSTAARRPELIVWPEAPSPLRQDDPVFRNWMSSLAVNQKASLIIGAMAVDFDPAIPRGYNLYNSAAFFASNGSYEGRYDKIHLVPFGEYIPFKEFLFFAKNLTQQAGDMDHGVLRVNFATGGRSYGTFICYESIFADEVRDFVRDGAGVLVNISDDGWYGDTSAPWQHLDMARMRAIENDRWLLRSTNTGITASIDPYGQVELSAPRHVRTAIAVNFDYNRRLTFYTRNGDVFAYACLLLTLLAMAFAAASESQSREKAS